MRIVVFLSSFKNLKKKNMFSTPVVLIFAILFAKTYAGCFDCFFSKKYNRPSPANVNISPPIPQGWNTDFNDDIATFRQSATKYFGGLKKKGYEPGLHNDIINNPKKQMACEEAFEDYVFNSILDQWQTSSFDRRKSTSKPPAGGRIRNRRKSSSNYGRSTSLNFGQNAAAAATKQLTNSKSQKPSSSSLKYPNMLYYDGWHPQTIQQQYAENNSTDSFASNKNVLRTKSNKEHRRKL